MRRSLGVMLALILGLLLPVTPAAAAGGVCTPTHCHGIVMKSFSPGANKGAYSSIAMHCVGVENGFVTNEMWVVFNTGGWVEVGIAYQLNFMGGPRAFWAEKHYGVYSEHQMQAVNTNTYYYMDIQYVGGGNWRVNTAGQTGTAGNSPGHGDRIDTGFEADNDNARNRGNTIGMGWYSGPNGGGAVNGWGGANGYATGIGQVGWNSVWSDLRYGGNSC